jgi:hypothetical protein
MGIYAFFSNNERPYRVFLAFAYVPVLRARHERTAQSVFWHSDGHSER